MRQVVNGFHLTAERGKTMQQTEEVEYVTEQCSVCGSEAVSTTVVRLWPCVVDVDCHNCGTAGRIVCDRSGAVVKMIRNSSARNRRSSSGVPRSVRS